MSRAASPAPAAAGRNRDVAAIHVMKAQLRLSDDDYRALLRGQTGELSCSSMSAQQLRKVRLHLERLVHAAGAGRAGRQRLSAEAFREAKERASPKERKAWALWHQLARDGQIEAATARSLDAFVARQVHVSALRFCNEAQLDTVIESLKGWVERAAQQKAAP